MSAAADGCVEAAAVADVRAEAGGVDREAAVDADGFPAARDARKRGSRPRFSARSIVAMFLTASRMLDPVAGYVPKVDRRISDPIYLPDIHVFDVATQPRIFSPAVFFRFGREEGSG